MRVSVDKPEGRGRLILNHVADTLMQRVARLDPDKPAPEICDFTMRGAHLVNVKFDA